MTHRTFTAALLLAALLPACHDHDDDYYCCDAGTGAVRFVNASVDTGDTRFFVDYYEHVELGTNEATGYASFYDGYRWVDLYKGTSYLFSERIFVNRDDEQSYYLIGSRPAKNLQLVGVGDALGIPAPGFARLGVINANVDALRFDLVVDNQTLVRDVDYLGFVDPPDYVSVRSGRHSIRIVESGTSNTVGPFTFTLPDQRDVTVLIGGFAQSPYLVLLDEENGQALFPSATVRIVDPDGRDRSTIRAMLADATIAAGDGGHDVDPGAHTLTVADGDRVIARAPVRLEPGARYVVVPVDRTTGRVFVHREGPIRREAGSFVFDLLHLAPGLGRVDVAVDGRRVLEGIAPEATGATAYAAVPEDGSPARIDLFAAGTDTRLASATFAVDEETTLPIGLRLEAGSAVLLDLRRSTQNLATPAPVGGSVASD